MGWFSFIICGIATYLAFKTNSAISIFALINAIANFWSFGIMHNYGGHIGVGGNYERFVITLNMITTIVGIILLIIVLINR